MFTASETAELKIVLDYLGAEINEINAANGWEVMKPNEWEGGNKYKVPAALGLVHSEVSEALEAYRKGDRKNFIEEMADTVIRCLDVTHGLGMDIGEAIFAKLEKNRHRGYRHGGKRI